MSEETQQESVTVKVDEKKTRTPGKALIVLSWPVLVDAMDRYAREIRPLLLSDNAKANDLGYFFPSTQTGGKMSHHADAINWVRDIAAKNGQELGGEELRAIKSGHFRKAYSMAAVRDERIGPVREMLFFDHSAETQRKSYHTDAVKDQVATSQILHEKIGGPPTEQPPAVAPEPPQVQVYLLCLYDMTHIY